MFSIVKKYSVLFKRVYLLKEISIFLPSKELQVSERQEAICEIPISDDQKVLLDYKAFLYEAD